MVKRRHIVHGDPITARLINALAQPPVQVLGSGRITATRVNDVVNLLVPVNINRDPGEWIRLTDEGDATSGLSVPGAYSATFLQKDQTEHPRPDIVDAAFDVQGYKGLPTDDNPDPWSKTGLIVRAWRGEVVDRSGTQTQIWYFEHSRRGSWIRLTLEGDGDSGNRAVGEFDFVKVNDDQTAHTGMNREAFAKEVNGKQGIKTDDTHGSTAGHIVWAWIGDVIDVAGTMTEVWYFHEHVPEFWAVLDAEGETDGVATAHEIPGRYSFTALTDDLAGTAHVGSFSAVDVNGAEGLPCSGVTFRDDQVSKAQGGTEVGQVVLMRFKGTELRGAVETPLYAFDGSRRGGWFRITSEFTTNADYRIPGHYQALALADDHTALTNAFTGILFESNNISGIAVNDIVWAEVSGYIVDPVTAANRLLIFRFEYRREQYFRLFKRDPTPNAGLYSAYFVTPSNSSGAGAGLALSAEYVVREINGRDWLDTDDQCGDACGLVVRAFSHGFEEAPGGGGTFVAIWYFEHYPETQIGIVEEVTSPGERGSDTTDADIRYNVYHECANIATDPPIITTGIPHRSRLPKTTYIPGPDESKALIHFPKCGGDPELMVVYKEIEEVLVFNCHHHCHCPPAIP